MQEEHRSFNPPEPDAVLWRYMDFTKFVSLLDTQSLYLARADLLGDPFEGSSPARNVKLRPHRYPSEFIEKISSTAKIAREMIFVSCWHVSNSESAAMWRLYSREHDGIAIRTDYQSLWNSMTDTDMTYVGQVSYIDYSNTVISEGNIFDSFLFKRKEFEHEQEVRLVRLEMGSNPPNGICHAVVLSVLIKAIVIAPYAQDWFDTLVRSVADRYGLGDYVARSSLGGTPSW